MKDILPLFVVVTEFGNRPVEDIASRFIQAKYQTLSFMSFAR